MGREALQAIINDCPYHAFLGLEVASVDEQAARVVIRLPWRAEFSRSTQVEQYHGGITAALIDLAGVYALALRLQRTVPTINMRVDYLRMAEQTSLTASAHVVKCGRSIGLVDIEIHDDDARLIAVGRVTYSTA